MSFSELMEAFRLRYRIFKSPVGFTGEGMDIDPFDAVCDHLVVTEKTTGHVIGTYRMQSSLHTQRFYSETEFDLSRFQNMPGIKLELGRACVDKEHRNGSVIRILWAGIHDYLTQIKADYLFGCSSIPTTELSVMCRIYTYLKQEGFLLEDWNIRPLADKNLPMLEHAIRSSVQVLPLNKREVLSLVPPLLMAYLQAGAKVYGLPAFDEEFQCFDFLTVLDTKDLCLQKKMKLA
jgi:putative hemolysin